MKLIVGVMDQRMRDFIKKFHFSEKMTIIQKMCNIKLIQEPVEIMIPFARLLDTGLFSGTFVHMEELLITLDVKSVSFGNIMNEDKMNTIAKKYNIPCNYVDYLQIRTNTTL